MSDTSNYVKLATSMAGFILVVFIIGVIFGGSNALFVVPVAWGIVTLGIVLGLFQLRADRPKAKK